MNIQVFRFRVLAVVASAAIMAVSSAALADPPWRVARLGYTTGPVSLSPAGENDWFDASINRPLTSGDRLWVDDGARAEVQVGGATIRLDAGTGASILNMDDQITQVQLTQGRLNVHLFRLEPGHVFEVDTPNLAFIPRRPGVYRIEVDPYGRVTTNIVRSGRGDAYAEGAAYTLSPRHSYRFMGTGLRDYEYYDVPRPDSFDRWSSDRDRWYENSISARYVSQDVVGYQDLDANGTWRVNVTFGNVWVPNRVATGWAPYRDGHWAWIDPWGWTWVDNAPWGFAVSHYGRWMNLGGTWGWVPGPVRARSYYAPALVVFLGGSNFRLRGSGGDVGGIALFPLGPSDVYRPSYPVSRRYFEDINSSNTVINNTVINNYYNNTNVTNVVYVNRQVPGAVVAVPRISFEQSQPVSSAIVPVSGQALASEPVESAPPVAPTGRSVRGAAAKRDRPPPPAHVGFAAQQPQLKANPGKPLDDNARKQLKRGAAAPAPVVNVIAQAPEAPSSEPPPPPSRAPEQRGQSAQQGKSGQQREPADVTASTPPRVAQPVEAASPPQRSTEPHAVPPAQATSPAPPAEQRGNSTLQGKAVQPDKSRQQGKGAQQGQPADRTPATPPVEATPPAQNAASAPAGSEPATTEPAPATGKKKDKKKAVDEPTPGEPSPEEPMPEAGGTQTRSGTAEPS